MNVENRVHPEQEQIKALLGNATAGPVVMVNLLKFRAQAEYEDGRDTDLSGREAYFLYGSRMREIVEAGGGRFVSGGPVLGLMIGKVEEVWDFIGLVEYPSKQAFIEIVSQPEVAEISVHRKAGLAGQLLIPITETWEQATQ